MGAIFASLDRDDDVLNVGINRAVDALAKKLESVRTLGSHPVDSEPVVVRKGRFGPYVQHGNTVANLPKSLTMEDMRLEVAVQLLAERGKTLKPRGGRKGNASKPKAAPKRAPSASSLQATPGSGRAKGGTKAGVTTRSKRSARVGASSRTRPRANAND